MHTFSVGGGTLFGGFDALDFRLILAKGDAGKFGQNTILSKLPDKFARFLYEFHDFRFQRLDLAPLPHDRSIIDVHAILSPDQVIHTTFINLFKCLSAL